MTKERKVVLTEDMAKKLYNLGNEFKDFALSVYSKFDLTHDKIDYEYIRNKFKERYPIGTVVHSTDVSDTLPHIIISEPYVKAQDYHWSDCPYDKMIVFDTLTISMYDKTLVKSRLDVHYSNALEECKIMDLYGKELVLDYDKWKEITLRQSNTKLSYCEHRITELNEQIETYKNEISLRKDIADNFDNIYEELYKQYKSYTNKK